MNCRDICGRFAPSRQKRRFCLSCRIARRGLSFFLSSVLSSLPLLSHTFLGRPEWFGQRKNADTASDSFSGTATVSHVRLRDIKKQSSVDKLSVMQNNHGTWTGRPRRDRGRRALQRVWCFVGGGITPCVSGGQ